MYSKFEIVLIYMSCKNINDVMNVTEAFRELMELAHDFSNVAIIEKLALRRIVILNSINF